MEHHSHSSSGTVPYSYRDQCSAESFGICLDFKLASFDCAQISVHSHKPQEAKERAGKQTYNRSEYLRHFYLFPVYG